jgi:hypothetical protein
LSAVAGLLGTEDRERVLQEVLAIARQIKNDVVAHTIALSLVTERLGAEDGNLLQEALSITRKIKDDSYRASALSMVAKRLGTEDRKRALQEALLATRQIRDDSRRAKALIAVVERLDEDNWDLLQEALTIARQIGDDSHRASALSAMAKNCGPGEKADLAEDLLAVVHTDEAISGIASLAVQWVSFCLHRNSSTQAELGMWLEPLSRCERPHLISALTSLIPAIEVTGGQEALAEMAVAIAEVGRYWR